MLNACEQPLRTLRQVPARCGRIRKAILSAIRDARPASRRPAHPGGYRPRSQALPETAVYRDSGCPLAPSCLDCPFPFCRHDRAHARARFLRANPLYLQIINMSEAGMGTHVIAEKLGVSRRTVFRARAQSLRENRGITSQAPRDMIRLPRRG